MAVAPDGDIFVSDSGAGEVFILHAAAGQPVAESREVSAGQLNLPFGIAFHDDYAYVADADEVLRFHYDPRTSRRLRNPDRILDLPGGGYNQHWTRFLAFSPDGKRMFVSVGSRTDVSIESDPRRGTILVSDPDGRNMRIYATGFRNAVGIGFNCESTELWATANEREKYRRRCPVRLFYSCH
jgi:glucose/arabinose dehydrogenase